MKLDNKNEHKNESKSNQYHWLVYPQESMPNYIYEAKKRLGQVKEPFVAPKNQNAASTKSSSQIKNEENSKNTSDSQSNEVSCNKIETEVDVVAAGISKPPRSANGTNSNSSHWMSWSKPLTPEKVKLIRKRLGDDRYRRIKTASHAETMARANLNGFENSDFQKNNSNETSPTLKITNTVVFNNEDNSSNNKKDANLNEHYKIPDAASSLELNNKVLVTYPQNEPYSFLPVEETKDKFKHNIQEYSNDQNIIHLESNERTKSRSTINNLDSYTINTGDSGNTITLENWMQTANEQGMYLFFI